MDTRLCCASIGSDQLDGNNTPTWESSSYTWGLGIAFNKQESFDFATMQFALHYMCQSSERLATFFQSWSVNLKTGRYFIATTVDAAAIRSLAASQLSSSTTNEVLIEDELGRVACRLKFDADAREQLLDKGDDACWTKTLGIRYDMTLIEYNQDGEGYNFVQAPEWIVPIDTLTDYYARTYGNLELVHEESSNFHDFYRQKKRNETYKRLLAQMKVVPADNTDEPFSKIEWELTGLYRTLVFRKK